MEAALDVGYFYFDTSGRTQCSTICALVGSEVGLPTVRSLALTSFLAGHPACDNKSCETCTAQKGEIEHGQPRM